MTLRWRVGKQLNFQKAFLARENQCFFHDADFEVDKNINKTNRYTVSYRQPPKGPCCVSSSLISYYSFGLNVNIESRINWCSFPHRISLNRSNSSCLYLLIHVLKQDQIYTHIYSISPIFLEKFDFSMRSNVMCVFFQLSSSCAIKFIWSLEIRTQRYACKLYVNILF